MTDPKDDPTERLTKAIEHIAECLNHICTDGIFVKIDDDISEN